MNDEKMIWGVFMLERPEMQRAYFPEENVTAEWCNFNYVFSNSAIWNNGGDCAYLMDAQGNPIDEYCY